MSVEREALLGRVLAAWEASERGRLFLCEGVSPSLLAEAGHAASGLLELASVVDDIRRSERESAGVELLEAMAVHMWTHGFRVGMARQADLGSSGR